MSLEIKIMIYMVEREFQGGETTWPKNTPRPDLSHSGMKEGLRPGSVGFLHSVPWNPYVKCIFRGHSLPLACIET